MARKKSGTPVFGVFAVVAAIVLAGVGFWLYRDNAAATQEAAQAALQKPTLPTDKLVLLQGGLAQSRFLSLDDIDRGKDVIHATVLVVGATATGLEGGAAMISQRKGYDCARRHVFDGQAGYFDAYGKVMTTKTFSTGRHGRIAESDDMEVPAICDKAAPKGQTFDGYAAAQREVQQVPDDYETWAAAHPQDPEVWAAVDAAGAKGRFLAVMSHEMRTPLNGVAGHAQLLAARSDLSAEGRTHVEVLQASCQVLLSLINDVLDYSTTDNGQLRLETGPFAMAEVVRRTAQIVEPMLAGRPVTLEVAVGAVEGATHLGDSRRVAQVLLNLLGNAVKFTERGHIRVEVERRTRGETDLLKIRVHDTGIGVAADKRDLLFQPFSQVDSGVTRNFDGAGLGLAIAKSLVDLMGGQIGMRGEPGGGSEFWFEIPCPATATVTPLIAAPPVPAAGLGQARILVVDDHPVNRQVASMMLIAAGFDVECAEDGLQAVEAVGARDFDIVFMDLHMPVMDGLTACRTIRALDGGRRRTPVVAVTAAATAEDVERCRAAGMDAHIAKPISYDALVDAVARYGLHARANRGPEGLAASS